ncbi:hypothetical protein NpPPO83_00005736 [Neofusicoccum parvum]|uniref:Uncharacterized protein n=1 Tax=Neofusicoccum parvum TaxID=310453 RepID=A0ACB5RRW0_9PEZI|nr:hypothetical protein NpPPO83_00005736 [Neofusicoccum parvum]
MDQIQRKSTNTHKCTVCKNTSRQRCVNLGHVAKCAATGCKFWFNVREGCQLHPYRDGFNEHASPKQRFHISKQQQRDREAAARRIAAQVKERDKKSRLGGNVVCFDPLKFAPQGGYNGRGTAF